MLASAGAASPAALCSQACYWVALRLLYVNALSSLADDVSWILS